MVRSPKFLKLTAATLVAVLALTSCSGDAPTAPSNQSVQAVSDSSNKLFLPIVTPLLNGLVSCPTQQYARTQEWVGPDGGTIEVGRHKLVIPRGALTSRVLITAETPADQVVSVKFSPEGLQFRKDAKLTLDYSSCPLARLDLFKHIAYTTNLLSILNLLDSQDNILTAKISTDLEHFSRYAVAW
jgi:hypothetical protein